MVVANRQRKPFKSSQDSRAFVAYEAAGGQIDEANNVVRGVKVVGRKSAHGYEYSEKAVEEAKNLYEGARVYFGHKKERATRTGDYGDGFGVLKNYHVKEGEGYADLHYNPHHPRAAQFLYDVKNTPKDLGFSHHADIRVSSNRGRTVVESIDKVYSVDIVNVPATTKGVFESEGDTMLTLKQMIEAATPKSLTVLEDMMSGGSLAPDMPVDVAEGSDADAQIKAAFRSAVTAAFDDESLDSKATLAKIKDVLNAYDKLTGAGKKADKPAGNAAPATESVDDLKSKLTKLERKDEIRSLAAAEKVELSELNLRVAVALESEADRTAFVKSLPKLGAKAPAPRPGNTTGGTVLESTDDAPKGPPTFKTAEERAAFLRS